VTSARLRAGGRRTGRIRAALAIAAALACAHGEPAAPERPAFTPAGTRGAGASPSPTYLAALARRGVALDLADPLAARVISEYGAVFVAQGEPHLPPTWMFPDESATGAFQAQVDASDAPMGAFTVRLQREALDALEAARREAQAAGVRITPNSAEAARRSFADTVRLWDSRVRPGLEHWVAAGRLGTAEAARIRGLPPVEQVRAVLRLEERGLPFSPGFRDTILHSVAAPGTSQHLSMLALDVTEHGNPAVRALLARHGWFQTVAGDLPHFTFVGAREEELRGLGLVPLRLADRTYWVVDAPRPRGAPAPEPTELCPF
jgi:hypothetical protein